MTLTAAILLGWLAVIAFIVAAIAAGTKRTPVEQAFEDDAQARFLADWSRNRRPSHFPSDYDATGLQHQGGE